MVLEYLHRAAVCHDGGPQDAAGRKRRASKSSPPPPSSVLAPAARLWKHSADALSAAVRPRGDGLTDEQRAARRRREERKQILHAKLKKVRATAVRSSLRRAAAC
jgi:hypothetical protein